MKWLIVVFLSWCIGFISYPLIWQNDADNPQGQQPLTTDTAIFQSKGMTVSSKTTMSTSPQDDNTGHDSEAIKAPILQDATPYMSIFKIMQLAEQDPLEALLIAQETQHEDLYGFILEIAGKKQISNVISWLEQQKQTEQYESLLDSYLRGLASVNPQQALSEVDILTTEPMKSSVIMSIVDSWASTDAMAAFQWLKQQPETPSTLKMYLNTMYYYIEQSPTEAASLISSLPLNESTNYLITSMVYQLVEKNIQEAIDWLDSIAIDQRANGVFIISRKMAETDPEAALAFLNNQKQTYELNLDYYNSAVAEIASVDPDMMLDRIENYDANVQRDIIINASYALADYSESQFLQVVAMLSEDNQDIAYRQRASQLTQTDPQQAFNIAERISDTSVRLESIISTVNVWSGFDKKNALIAIENSNQLTASQKADISSQMQLQLTSSNMIYP
ncbi:hypothetical protein K8B83_14475 [Shewanella inventionis]|uniref:HEAT repeat domain-containing protein n=1 Tax=Shewanella inventionis TaxID=1738770 RepID=A0ABQ1J369_9GAMM|nr:hypothetical protein [Shewanella inventionis]MCL1157437.1 hypothetical protein [Shewanella inventionis]UAL42084.1 hypothetical protein K8B83_14475 [Shewanella inventionis]GGB58824.1 hypothetical protein GCM10011607_19340 [Shewanella inventionis]